MDVSGTTALLYLKCYDNSLTSLNVTGLTGLLNVVCSINNLSSLDVSTNKVLEELYCSENSLTSLDVSANRNLYKVIANDNDLISLNVANGINSFVLTSQFNTTNNPNLTCIQVDDVSYSTTNWTSIDATASFVAKFTIFSLSLTPLENPPPCTNTNRGICS